MCGIAGYWAWHGGHISNGTLENTVSTMAAASSNRGPDSEGTWVDEYLGIALGHQRLAIQDLSIAGHQPAISACGRYVITLNGEIYNHLDLRISLELKPPISHVQTGGLEIKDSRITTSGVTNTGWKGHSDTETLLAAIAVWGVEDALNRCVGMFAFGLWDREKRTLTLARDRFGEKPLYYGWVGQGVSRAFAFASELKGLQAYPGFNNAVNREALAQYLRFTYVPAPLSIYEGISKLEPGCLLTVSRKAGDFEQAEQLEIHHRHWFSFGDLVTSSIGKPLENEEKAISELEQSLAQAVKAQSISDVPLGVFLSGGVDSSTIAALMQEQTSTPIKTFTIGFDESGFDEAPYARAVAEHLGTDHTEMRVTAQMAQDVIKQLPHMYDEPFADSSQIPMHLVCRAARQHVTVVLSGDAGDELFGGYNRYFWGPRIWGRVSWLPFGVRKLLGQLIQLVPISGWNALSRWVGVSRLGEKAHKLAIRLKTVRTAEDLYWSLVTEWSNPEELVVGAKAGQPERVQSPPNLKDPLSMMYLDTLTYLPDDILCKVDRAAMACSLETRVPFLDHRVVELAWRLPLHMKIRKGVSKWALRQVLYKRVPKELIERPKAGFAIPIGQWLRGPLREWAEALLNPSRLKAEGYLHPEPITKVWQEHLSGHYDHTPKLWSVLMFQAWLEHQGKPVKVA
jgi:asparagine synthase (glutamine-hydrolysing)